MTAAPQYGGTHSAKHVVLPFFGGDANDLTRKRKTRPGLSLIAGYRRRRPAFAAPVCTSGAVDLAEP
jgi:hypothetical protein